MAYRLKPARPLVDEVRRIALEQIDRTLSTAGAEPQSGRWVHETRKRVKRLRAMLRLVREGLGEPVWQRQNVALRDVGRSLSPLRDSTVLGARLLELEADAGTALAVAAARLREAWQTDPAAGSARPPGSLAEPKLLQQACEALGAIRTDLQRVKLKGEDLAVIKAGIARCRKSARRCHRAAHKLGTDDALHDLRKAVQMHWRQLQLLETAWPRGFETHIERARRLAQTLGEDHDLALLAGKIAAAWGKGPHAKAADCVARACRLRQRQLRTSALIEADLLFATSARAFAAEMARYWQVAGDRRRLTALKAKATEEAVATVPAKQRSKPAAGLAKSRLPAAKGTGARQGNRAKKAANPG